MLRMLPKSLTCGFLFQLNTLSLKGIFCIKLSVFLSFITILPLEILNKNSGSFAVWSDCCSTNFPFTSLYWEINFFVVSVDFYKKNTGKRHSVLTRRDLNPMIRSTSAGVLYLYRSVIEIY